MTAPFRIEALREEHDRAIFRCGEEALDRYLETQVSQDIRRRVTSCFVAIDVLKGAVAGFYTIAATSIAIPDLPFEMNRLPRYPTLPCVRIGRLAVDANLRGKGLGGALLVDALETAVRSDVAAYAAIVDAKNAEAVAFYEHFGFQRLAGSPQALSLPLATAAKAMTRSRSR